MYVLTDDYFLKSFVGPTITNDNDDDEDSDGDGDDDGEHRENKDDKYGEDDDDDDDDDGIVPSGVPMHCHPLSPPSPECPNCNANASSITNCPAPMLRCNTQITTANVMFPLVWLVCN